MAKFDPRFATLSTPMDNTESEEQARLDSMIRQAAEAKDFALGRNAFDRYIGSFHGLPSDTNLLQQQMAAADKPIADYINEIKLARDARTQQAVLAQQALENEREAKKTETESERFEREWGRSGAWRKEDQATAAATAAAARGEKELDRDLKRELLDRAIGGRIELKKTPKGGILGGGIGGPGLSKALRDDPDFADKLVEGDHGAIVKALKLSNPKEQAKAATGLIKTVGTGSGVENKIAGEDRKKFDDFVQERKKSNVDAVSNDVDEALRFVTSNKKLVDDWFIAGKDPAGIVASVRSRFGDEKAKEVVAQLQRLGRLTSGYARSISGLVVPEPEFKRIDAQISGPGVKGASSLTSGLKGLKKHIDDTDEADFRRFADPGAAAAEYDRRALSLNGVPSGRVRKMSADYKNKTGKQPTGSRKDVLQTAPATKGGYVHMVNPQTGEELDVLESDVADASKEGFKKK